MTPASFSTSRSAEILALEAQITENLRKLDEQPGEEIELSASEYEVWKAVLKCDDLNEMVRFNVQSIQRLIIDLQNEIIQSFSISQGEIAKLRMGTPKEVEAYVAVIENYERTKKDRLDTLTKLVKCFKDLVKEYRESAMAKKSTVHISQVQKLLMVFKDVLHKYINDPTTLTKVSEECYEAMRKIFPMGA